MKQKGAPGSLASVPTLAPWLMFVSGVSTILLFIALASSHEQWNLLLAFGPPTLGTTFGALLLARQRPGRAVAAMFGVGALQALVGALVWPYEGIFVSVVVCTVAYVLASPALTLISAMGKRRERDAGDTLLLWGGLWSVAIHSIYVYFLLESRSEVLGLGVALAGLALSLAAVVVAVLRATNRRAFTRRVLQGKVPGFRVREATATDLLRLPPLYAIKWQREARVLERIELDPASSPYRGGTLASPIAVIPVPA